MFCFQICIWCVHTKLFITSRYEALLLFIKVCYLSLYTYFINKAFFKNWLLIMSISISTTFFYFHMIRELKMWLMNLSWYWNTLNHWPIFLMEKLPMCFNVKNCVHGLYEEVSHTHFQFNVAWSLIITRYLMVL